MNKWVIFWKNLISETIKNEAKEQKGGFIGMFLGTLGASLLENLLTVKWAIEMSQGQGQLEQVKVYLELVKVLLEQVRILNAAKSFTKLWNTKALSKQI